MISMIILLVNHIYISITAKIFSDALLSFDGLFLQVDIGSVSVLWDGLSFGKISVPEEMQSCGLCGNNDGQFLATYTFFISFILVFHYLLYGLSTCRFS